MCIRDSCRVIEKIKVVELRPAALERRFPAAGSILRHIGNRQHDAEESAMRNAFALKPDLTVAAIDHIANGKRRRFAGRVHRIHFPGHRCFVIHETAGPDQIELRQTPFKRQGKAYLTCLLYTSRCV